MSRALRAKELIEEIRQIREQYQAEVGSKRKPWPKSIRERVIELCDLGVAMPKIAEQIEVPYQTVTSWRKQKKSQPTFHALTVSAPTVTVGAGGAPAPSAYDRELDPTVTVRVTKENLWTIEIPASKAGMVLRELGLAKCF
jgi:hypothetical protein